MKTLSTLIFALFLSISLFSQEKALELTHNRRDKVKRIELNTPIVLITLEEDKIKGVLVDLDEGHLTIKDNNGTENKIELTAIHKIKRDRFDNTRWLEPFGYIAIGAGLALAAVPIVWIFDGGVKALEGLAFAGMLSAVSFPAILIGTSKRGFNVKERWSLTVVN